MTLTVSRNVTLNDYLVIPAIMGGAVTILSLILSGLFVWLYDRRRHRSPSGTRNWLTRPILGSGAWTANDSWATNISTGLVVVGAVLAATTAANSLFPGVALDRFAIVNVGAGFFVAAAPVLFGILYSWLTASKPGLIADTTVELPRLRPATVSLPSGASITLAADTIIQDGSARWATVRGGGTYQVAPGATIRVAAGIQGIARSLCEKISWPRGRGQPSRRGPRARSRAGSSGRLSGPSGLRSAAPPAFRRPVAAACRQITQLCRQACRRSGWPLSRRSCSRTFRR